jgi:hypothetical protein
MTKGWITRGKETVEDGGRRITPVVRHHPTFSELRFFFLVSRGPPNSEEDLAQKSQHHGDTGDVVPVLEVTFIVVAHHPLLGEKGRGRGGL